MTNIPLLAQDQFVKHWQATAITVDRCNLLIVCVYLLIGLTGFKMGQITNQAVTYMYILQYL